MIDSELAKFIQKGDFCECNHGTYEAVMNGYSRYGTSHELHIVSVQARVCQLPIECKAIKAVWRNGVCVWRRGESLRQLSMFEAA